MRAILEYKRDDETIPDLLARTAGSFQDASEFLWAVDVLYVLGALDIEASTGVVKYAT
ncbi:ABC-three component system middle component 7 [Burkholderia pyrrocinia]|uniref:ABC-three component system middle component 7 n=1 Tax=Burkholderia pyrrocinia TaxID=60550 RepID=UPI003D7686CE